MSTAYNPPPIPLAPLGYDPHYTNNVMRILVQHLEQVRGGINAANNQAVNAEVLTWLS